MKFVQKKPRELEKFYNSLDFGEWFESSTSEIPKSETLEEEEILEKKSQVEELYQQLLQYSKSKQSARDSSEENWLERIQKAGTVSDRLAAMSLAFRKDPFFKLNLLEIIIGMAKKKGRHEAESSIYTLKDLFLNLLLPERKLKFFYNHEFNENTTDKHLIYYFFEDKLKSLYIQFVEILEKGSHNTVKAFKTNVLGVIYDLLLSKIEQEQKLLTLIVNKLGDPDKAICSKSTYLLSCLIQEHPNMTSHVVKEVESLIFRPNVSFHSQYYSVLFLSQIILSRSDSELAGKLLEIYFSLFNIFVSKGEVESRVMDGILTGISRAFPFCRNKSSKYEEHIDSLFRLVHISTFNKCVQALQVLYQSMSSRNLSDRFYRALYSKLLSEEIGRTSKQTLFLNLLEKSIQADLSIDRVKAFVKRLLHICTFQAPNFVCAVLFLIGKIIQNKPGLLSLIQQPEDIPSFEEVKVDEKNKKSSLYDPLKREPLYANAETTCFWELDVLINHYHPSVQKFAKTLLSGQPIEYNGNPLQDFSQTAFLERFVYKNPKKKERKPDTVLQPKYTRKSLIDLPVTSTEYLAKSEEEIPETEVFFYKYFKEKKKRNKSKSKKLEEELDFDEIGSFEDDIGSENLEGFEEDKESEAEYSYDDLGQEAFSEDSELESAVAIGEEEEDEDAEEMDGFADADEFAELLEDSGSSGINQKQENWEQRSSKNKKKRKFEKSFSQTKKKRRPFPQSKKQKMKK